MKQLIERCSQHNIPFLQEEPLKLHCSFQIGGAARLFIEPETKEHASIVLQCTSAQAASLLILGKGTNSLFGDGGYHGVVLHLGDHFANITTVDEKTIYAQSGALLLDLCTYALEQSLTGMEALYGIPGSVGGAIYMNAGAYGTETVNVLVSADHLNNDGTPGTYTGEELALSYRRSAYTDSDKLIMGGLFRLEPGDAIEIKAKMDDYMERRTSKQPLEYPSAGSTFKRPEGHYASALIDQCGLKGRSVGGAQVSEKHAGFVINRGNATAENVLDLIKEVQQEVYAKTGVQLEPEIRLIGKQE